MSHQGEYGGIGIERMTRLLSQHCQFSFQAQTLLHKLVEHIQLEHTGYWRHQFARLAHRETPFYWHVAMVNGQILYSGNAQLSADALLRVVQRYVPRTRQEAVKVHLNFLQKNIQAQHTPPIHLISQLKQLDVVNETQLLAALRLKILNDLDTYVLMGAGEAEFIPSAALEQIPLAGFNAQLLLEEAMQRQLLWYQLKAQVPSMNLLPVLNSETFERATLPIAQQERIHSLVQSGKTLNQIAVGFAQDPLEVAKTFAKLVAAQWVKLEAPQQAAPSTVMIIDDSPMVLMQFQHWVSALGYPVVVSQNAETALSTILKVNPSVIFIDINMPSISGFELAKQIRQQPQIASIPLVILTAEQKLSNKWRAQWSGCEFLTKPLSMAEVGQFQSQLQAILPKLVSEATGTDA
jgi:CheY-like chemotaxis protein